MKKNINSYLLQCDIPTQTNEKVRFILWRITLLLLSIISLGIAILPLAKGPYPFEVFLGYLSNATILFLNIFPILLLSIILWGLCGRLWISYLVTSIISIGLSLGHYYKITFRDDALHFIDLFIIKEAQNMVLEGDYSLFIDSNIFVAISCALFWTLILYFYAKLNPKGIKERLIAAIVTILISLSMWGVYSSDAIHTNISNYEHLEYYSPTQNYISRGFIYPFINSIKECIIVAPEGYDKEKARDYLSEYSDIDIPTSKKINVISIMREAYVDFSQYNINGLDPNIYNIYHKIQAESISGNLFVNIFAGGTIDSERSFLTGNYVQPLYRSTTNSYLWYLKKQGYNIEGSHPYHEWFYNRSNINKNIGFQKYRFLENDYEFLSDAEHIEDNVLLSEIYKDFVNNKKTGQPYFSFSVNIQSHGPYSTSSYNGDKVYLSGNYSDECKNAMNNYLALIHDSDIELLNLINKLKVDPDPVVLLIYTDHLPWMGDNKIFYEELGIKLDLETEEGITNHFLTDYIIWANDAAKDELGKDFTGKGPTISPFYLMNQLFEECSWDGPAFMQAMNEVKKVFPVITTRGFYMSDGILLKDIPQKYNPLFNKFLIMQYYWQNEFTY